MGYITFLRVVVSEPDVADVRAGPLTLRLDREDPVYAQECNCGDMHVRSIASGTLTLIAGTLRNVIQVVRIKVRVRVRVRVSETRRLGSGFGFGRP